MTRIIFLDIDGALNTHDYCPEAQSGSLHRDKVNRLNHALRVTDAKIVVSSAWRYLVHRGNMKLAGLEWLLRSHGVIANRLIGITRKDTMQTWEPLHHDNTKPALPIPNERGQQITDWLAVNHRNPSYVVVDDLDLGITAAGHPFVETQHDIGLTDANTDEIIKILLAGPKPTVN